MENNCYIFYADMLEFTVPQLTREKLGKLVRNRFEFQADAQLQGNEAELVQAIHHILLK